MNTNVEFNGNILDLINSSVLMLISTLFYGQCLQLKTTVVHLYTTVRNSTIWYSQFQTCYGWAYIICKVRSKSTLLRV